MSDECALEPDSGAQVRGRGFDRLIAELAERQHGIVGRGQLFEIGLGRRGIGYRIERGRLHPVYRGVYAVGHRVLTSEARWMAAVLVAGPEAVLSHRSAAALWGIRPSSRSRIEVIGGRRQHSRTGLDARYMNLSADEVTVVRGIPVTTVPRTLLDLAAVLSARQVERASHEAEVRRLTDRLSLDDLVERHAGRRGVATIKAILAAGSIGATVTRSDLEDRFLAFLDRKGLPRPKVNASLRLGRRWIEADCVWRVQRLVVELDGHATHATARSYERDRVRDRALNVAGWRVVRITWRQLHDDPDALAADLRELLSR